MGQSQGDGCSFMMAVVLRGHFRTWNICKHQWFQMMPQDAHWWFVSWQRSVDDEKLAQLHQDFAGRTYSIILVPEHEQYQSSWRAPAWLSQQVVHEVQQYPCVLESRPDVWVQWQHCPVIHPNTLHVTGHTWKNTFTRLPDGKHGWETLWHLEDFLFMMPGDVFPNMAARYDSWDPAGPHVELGRWADHHHIQVETLPEDVNALVIRPNYQPHALDAHQRVWAGVPRAEKQRLYDKWNIHPMDYQTNNRFHGI